MLNVQQIQVRLQLTAAAPPDSLDCDYCLHEIAAFAEAELAGKTLWQARQRVQIHLANCPGCRQQYEVLLMALRGMQDGPSIGGPPDAVTGAGMPLASVVSGAGFDSRLVAW